MRITARLARTGAQSYGDHIETRDAEDVFAPASLETYQGAPITVGHVGWLDASNVEKVAVGYVRSVSRDRGDGVTEYVRGELVITDEATARAIARGELREFSAGYSTDLVNGRQTNIRVNHVAILPRGGARCGEACSIAA